MASSRACHSRKSGKNVRAEKYRAAPLTSLYQHGTKADVIRRQPVRSLYCILYNIILYLI